MSMSALEFREGSRHGSTLQSTLEISLFWDRLSREGTSKLVTEATRCLTGLILPDDKLEHVPVRSRKYSEIARKYYTSIKKSDPSGEQARTFLMLVSTYLHELRHAHDLLGTWAGQEMLRMSRDCYQNIVALLEGLKEWQIHSQRPIPLPLPSDGEGMEGLSPDVKKLIARSRKTKDIQRAFMEESCDFSSTALSVRHMLETSAINMQLEYVRLLFGHKAADEVLKAIANGTESRMYFEAWNETRDLFLSRGFKGPALAEVVNYLIWCALSGVVPVGGDIRRDTVSPTALFEALIEHISRCCTDVNITSCRKAVLDFSKQWRLETPETAIRKYQALFAQRVAKVDELAWKAKYRGAVDLVRSFPRLKMSYDHLTDLALESPYVLFSAKHYVFHALSDYLPAVLVKLFYGGQRHLFSSHGIRLFTGEEWKMVSLFAKTLDLFLEGRGVNADVVYESEEDEIFAGLTDGSLWGYQFYFDVRL